MKKIVLSLAAAVLLFTACKKDDKKNESGSFTYNGKTEITNFAYTDGEDFTLSTISVEEALGNGNPTYSSIDFELENPKDDIAYTYKDFGADDYDAAKNFSYASATIDAKINDDASGTELDDLVSGTITVHKNNADGTSYKVEYKLTFSTTNGNKDVVGSYNGTMLKFQ